MTSAEPSMTMRSAEQLVGSAEPPFMGLAEPGRWSRPCGPRSCPCLAKPPAGLATLAKPPDGPCQCRFVCGVPGVTDGRLLSRLHPATISVRMHGASVISAPEKAITGTQSDENRCSLHSATRRGGFWRSYGARASPAGSDLETFPNNATNVIPPMPGPMAEISSALISLH